MNLATAIEWQSLQDVGILIGILVQRLGGDVWLTVDEYQAMEGRRVRATIDPITDALQLCVVEESP